MGKVKSTANNDLLEALKRATAILKACNGDEEVASDEVLFEMMEDVIPQCDAAIKKAEAR